MKTTILPGLALLIILPFMLWQASCEPPKTGPERELSFKVDSLQRVIDTLLVDRRDQQLHLNEFYDSLMNWKNTVTHKNIQIERLNLSLHDLNFDLNASRDHFKEMELKYLSRMDSATKIIKRQNNQLTYCKCEPNKP